MKENGKSSVELSKQGNHSELTEKSEANLEQDTEEFEIEGSRGDAPFKVHVIAGSMSGLMEHVLIFPMDTIKVAFIHVN